MTDPIVLPDSDEAASLKTVTGWVSREGRFYGNDELLARWAGSTHQKCGSCGEVTDKTYTECESCRHKSMLARYDALPVVEWDEKTPLTTYDDDEFFFDLDSVYDYCALEGCKVEDLLLVVCEPVYAREIDADALYCDDLPPDLSLEDVAPDLAEAFARLNDAIRAHKEPLSWVAGKHRVVIPEEEANRNG